MKKYIHIKKEDREFISKALNIGGKSIYNALHFDSDRGGTDLAKKVRKLALERGGIVMVEAPEEETLFDADGYMRQYLENSKVLLEFSLADNSCTVFVRGERVRTFEHVFVRDIPYIQAWAKEQVSTPQPQLA